MPAPKSPEGKAAKKIGDALNQRGLNNNLIAYFLVEEQTTEMQGETLDLFLHFVKMLANTPPNQINLETARLMGIADEIIRGVQRAGYQFRG